jgi:transposase
MTVVLMSRAELSRVETLTQVARGGLPVATAAALLDVSLRQVFRLLARFRAEGAAGLASRRRGRPSNHRLPDAIREAALALVRERYADFGPTLAAEKLKERHEIQVSRETLRGWMMAAGIWVGRKARAQAVHQPRYRRECAGELIQIDGCEHWWFEDRGPRCTLLAFVDPPVPLCGPEDRLQPAG